MYLRLPPRETSTLLRPELVDYPWHILPISAYLDIFAEEAWYDIYSPAVHSTTPSSLTTSSDFCNVYTSNGRKLPVFTVTDIDNSTRMLDMYSPAFNVDPDWYIRPHNHLLGPVAYHPLMRRGVRKSVFCWNKRWLFWEPLIDEDGRLARLLLAEEPDDMQTADRESSLRYASVSPFLSVVGDMPELVADAQSVTSADLYNEAMVQGHAEPLNGDESYITTNMDAKLTMDMGDNLLADLQSISSMDLDAETYKCLGRESQLWNLNTRDLSDADYGQLSHPIPLFRVLTSYIHLLDEFEQDTAVPDRTSHKPQTVSNTSAVSTSGAGPGYVEVQELPCHFDRVCFEAGCYSFPHNTFTFDRKTRSKISSQQSVVDEHLEEQRRAEDRIFDAQKRVSMPW